MSLWDMTSYRRQDESDQIFLCHPHRIELLYMCAKGISAEPTRSAFLVGRVILPSPQVFNDHQIDQVIGLINDHFYLTFVNLSLA